MAIKRKQRHICKSRFVKIPICPTKNMLQGMIEATFLKDSSLLEMERRFNGMLYALGKFKT